MYLHSTFFIINTVNIYEHFNKTLNCVLKYCLKTSKSFFFFIKGVNTRKLCINKITNNFCLYNTSEPSDSPGGNAQPYIFTSGSVTDATASVLI